MISVTVKYKKHKYASGDFKNNIFVFKVKTYWLFGIVPLFINQTCISNNADLEKG